MNVEKTMEFILQQQAKAEAERAKGELQMKAIRKLIQTGMRMIVKNEQQIKELTASQVKNEQLIKELAASQKVTEAKLQGLIDALRRGRNGSSKN
jgi:hypothetical protein